LPYWAGMKRAARLLKQYIPEHYQLELDIDEENLHFKGHVAISGEVVESTNQLTFHGNGLVIDKALIAEDDATVTINEADQTLTLTVDEEITGNQVIEMTFSGDITATMHGLYYSDYNEDSEQKRIISTQFESHHAREVFPCIDEPAAKATFELSVISSQPALSNTPEAELGEVDDGRIKTTFEPTPIMSTYLLALVSGELGQLESESANGTLVRVFAPPRDVKHLQFALETSVRILDFYEKYFGVEYPLQKCDMVAIPEFAAGAMENWGLITYRETALLIDKDNSSNQNKQYVAHVIAHELAHQWFGNLVTMSWWDDLWLNEGFASWIENLVVDELFPEWDVWTEFVAADYQGGLDADSLNSSHPIVQAVDDPQEINEIFDTVTYRKGPSVIRMLHDYMGSKQFRTGLQQYIRKFAYKNTVTDDLWQSLSAVTNINVADFMDNWINRRGFPLVTAKDKTITQQHFLPHPKKAPEDTVWQIPLTTTDGEILLNEQSITYAGDLPLTINSEQSSFIRVGYDKEHYQRLANAMSDDTLNAADRVGLISDVFAIAMSGEVSSADGLELVKDMASEPSAYVWGTIGAELGAIRQHLLGDKHQDLLAPFVEQLINEKYEQLGWNPSDSDTDAEQKIRRVVIALALRYELFDSVDTAKKLWDDFVNHDKPMHPDLRAVVYGYAGRTQLSDYDTLLKLYKKQTLNEEKLRFTRAITAIEDEAAAHRSLELIKTNDVRQQDVISWLAGLLRNPHTQAATWNWYRQDWDWLYTQFNQGHIYSYLAQILGFFNDESRVKEINEFFKDIDTAGLEVTLKQAVEQIETKSAWIARDIKPTRAWLKEYNS